VEEYGQPTKVEIKDQERKLAKQLIESLAAEWDAKKYHDEYQERQKSMIQAKLEGKEVAAAPQPQLAPVIDLMEALKKSLSERQAAPKKPPVRAAEPVPQSTAKAKKAARK